MSIQFITILLYFMYLNKLPVLEYDLDYSRWGKTQVGFIFHPSTDLI